MNCLFRSLNRNAVNFGIIEKLLNRNNYLNYENKRGFKLWWEKTMRLMHHRSRLFDVVSRKPEPRSTRQEWNFRAELFGFNQRLNEKFSEDSLKRAFTHISYVENEERKRKELGITDVQIHVSHNEELAVRGLDICNSYIKPYLRHFLPKLPEEGIECIYDYLISEPVLSDIAKWLGCVDLVLCADFPPKLSTLAQTVKALIGALAVDENTKHAENFVLDFVLTYLVDKDILEIWDIPNPGYNLKAILSRERLPAPEPRLLRESAIGTVEACYVVALYLNKQIIGSSAGETVEIAEKMAELDALRRSFGLTPSEVLFSFGPKAYGLDLSDSCDEALTLKEWTPSLVKSKNIKFIRSSQ